MVRRSTAGAILAALLLTSCTSDQAEPPDNPSEEPTTSPTEAQTQPAAETEDEPTAEPEPYPLPERPEAMDHDNLDGAEAAAIYFLELYFYAFATGDVENWSQMAGETCNACTTAHEGIAEIHEAGHTIETSPPQLESQGARISTDERGNYYVEIAAEVPRAREHDPSGELINEIPAFPYTAMLLLTQVQDRWSVGALQAETPRDDE